MNRDKIDLPQDKLVALCRRYQVRQLALFGSVLRDDFSSESDVDILVEFDPQAQIGLMAFLGLQEELEALLQRRVDLIPREGLKSAIKDDVLASAEVVYAV